MCFLKRVISATGFGFHTEGISSSAVLSLCSRRDIPAEDAIPSVRNPDEVCTNVDGMCSLKECTVYTEGTLFLY